MPSIQVTLKCRIGHRILGHPKCNNPHGEGLTIEVEIYSRGLNDDGMVCDFGPVKKVLKNGLMII